MGDYLIDSFLLIPLLAISLKLRNTVIGGNIVTFSVTKVISIRAKMSVWKILRELQTLSLFSYRRLALSFLKIHTLDWRRSSNGKFHATKTPTRATNGRHALRKRGITPGNEDLKSNGRHNIGHRLTEGSDCHWEPAVGEAETFMQIIIARRS